VSKDKEILNLFRDLQNMLQ